MLNVVLTEDGAPINESAYCDNHREFSDMCYASAEDAEDAPSPIEFSEVTDEFAANNDTVCFGCRLDKQIEDEALPSSKFGWTDWQSEEEELGSDGRKGVYWIEIFDPNGEEYAVIIHRTVDGQFPLDGIVAKVKEARAQQIVDALNAA